MDKISSEERSENMRRIRSKDTKPEMLVRRMVYKLGYRYRLHAKLPGRPDLVFSKKKKLIFIHGCFWHQHDDRNCKISRVPKSKIDYWLPKLEKNKKRDADNQIRLKELGWDFMIVWECQLRDKEELVKQVKGFLKA